MSRQCEVCRIEASIGATKQTQDTASFARRPGCRAVIGLEPPLDKAPVTLRIDIASDAQSKATEWVS